MNSNSSRLYDQFFDEFIHLFPSLNDYLGIDKYKKLRVHLENSISEQFIGSLKRFFLKYNTIVKNKKKHNIYDKTLLYNIKMGLESLEYPFHLLPIDQMNDGVSMYFQETAGIGVYMFKTTDDYIDFMKKNKDYYVWCCQVIVNLKTGIEEGITLPKIITTKLINNISNSLQQKLYYNKKVPASLRKEWDNNVNLFVIEPSKNILNFLKNEYIKKCRTSLGYCGMKNGKKMYEFIVRDQTTQSKLNVKKIHELGWSEIRRIEKEIKEIAKKYGSKNHNNIRDFFIEVASLPENHFKNKKELISFYKQIRTKLWNKVIPENFDLKIKKPYEMKEVPEAIAESMAGAYYVGGDVNNKRDGIFYLNTRDVKNMNKSDALALSKHEGLPGHHFQITLLNSDKKIPLFIKASMLTAYIEGWALYSENLGEYTDLEYVGKLNSEIFRAVRLVIDTGIHYYGWTYEKCRDICLKYTSFPISEIDAEIYRYSAMPGQALAYKMGELTILKLRKKYKGSIKHFHRKILENGPLPLDILESKFK